MASIGDTKREGDVCGAAPLPQYPRAYDENAAFSLTTLTAPKIPPLGTLSGRDVFITSAV
jgi:hypothetical protein